MKKALLLLTTLTLNLAHASYEPMQLPVGTASVGGSLLFIPSFDKEGNVLLQLGLNPLGGYFVYDQLELRASIGVDAVLYASQPLLQGANSPYWGLSIGLTYYFNCLTFFPFLGLGIGYKTQALQFIDNTIALMPSVGIMVPINSSIGLVFEVPFLINFRFTPAGNTQEYRIPIGFTGIRAFF